MAARRKRGFTLVELLVVISIIGVLMGLILPAVQSTREIARQNTCANNMKQLSLGVIQFENDNRRFPGHVNSVGPGNLAVNWTVMTFPYIERGDLWNIWSRRPRTNQTHKSVGISVFQCPSNPPVDLNFGPLAFVVNAGFYGPSGPVQPYQENRADGIFFNHYNPNYPNPASPPNLPVTVSLEYIASNDGTSTTILMSENIQRRFFGNGRDDWATWNVQTREFHGFVWYRVVDTNPGRMINMEKQAQGSTVQASVHARPSSHHPQGVNVSFADGHVKFIAQSIEYGIFRQLMTPAGALSNDEYNDQFLLDESRIQ